MAEESELAGDPVVVAAETAPSETEEPKKRRGRPKKSASEASGGDLVSPALPEARAKRGGPRATGRGLKRAGLEVSAEQRVPAPLGTSSESSDPLDELDDLLQLEQENQTLRKLLAEKLREENASLRRRLGIA